MALITYTDKTALNENTQIADNNKTTANDMNEIKSVVNQNATDVGDVSNLITNEKNIVQAINEVAETSGVVIYKKTLETQASSIVINNLDLERDKHYKIEFRGSSYATGEIQIKLNDLTNVYQHIVISAQAELNNDTDITPRCVWRGAASIISFNTQVENSGSDAILNIDLWRGSFNNSTTRYNIDYSYPNPYTHTMSFIRGQVNLDTHDNITSVTITNDGGTFREGTAVVVRKID